MSLIRPPMFYNQELKQSKIFEEICRFIYFKSVDKNIQTTKNELIERTESESKLLSQVTINTAFR